MTETGKTREIETINERLAALREQASEKDAETRAHIEKRDNLNEQVKKLRNEIRELKNERDKQNENVKTLKQQRDEARDKIRTIAEEIKADRQKIVELKKNIPKISRALLQKELDDIEWKIQTTSLDLQEEKKLIEQVKQLEKQLNIYKKIEKQNERITVLGKEFQALKTKADECHQELTNAAQKSQKFHANMSAKVEELEKVKSEADSLHKAYIQAKELTKPIHEEIRRLIEQKRQLQNTMRQEDERKRKATEQALKEKLGSQAKDKLQRGEKLSWDEFQLLADDKPEDNEA